MGHGLHVTIMQGLQSNKRLHTCNRRTKKSLHKTMTVLSQVTIKLDMSPGREPM